MLDQPTDFTGGVAVITGAGSGIGAGLARTAALRGMRVVLADVTESAIVGKSQEISALGGEAIAVVTDVSDPAQVEALAERAFSEYGDVDIIFNNAGVESLGNTWDMTPEGWAKVIGVNLNGVFNGIRSFVPRMLESVPNRSRRAHVVNTASVAALYTRPHSSAYGATKHAVLSLTESVALEIAEITDRIVLSAVLPGAVRTKVFTSAPRTDEDGPGAKAKEAMAKILEETGISPVKAAEIILDGVSRGLLHIHTDPTFSRELIEGRHQILASNVHDLATA